MFEEFKTVRQEKNGFKRLFFCNKYNLYIWYNKKNGEIIGFQIIYMKEKTQKAFTWERKNGYMNNTVDEGDSSRVKLTPILVHDGNFCKNEILSDIRKEMKNIEREISDFVLQK